MDRKRVIEQIVESFHSIHHKVGTTIKPCSPETDFTYSQMVILQIVKKNPGIGIKDLASALGITSSAATQQVDTLVKKGFLEREGNTEDRRSLNLRLSAKSEADIKEMKQTFINRLVEFFSVLTDEELATFATLNKKVAEKILNKQGASTTS